MIDEIRSSDMNPQISLKFNITKQFKFIYIAEIQFLELLKIQITFINLSSCFVFMQYCRGEMAFEEKLIKGHITDRTAENGE